MKTRKEGDLYVAILEMGEEIIESLTEFAVREQMKGASITAIGALRDFELGYFYLDKKEYGRKKFNEIAELISCSGNLAYVKDKPFIHMHAVLGRDNFSVIGGHLFAGTVAVTAEIIIFPFPERIERTYDERTGLNLISLTSGKTL